MGLLLLAGQLVHAQLTYGLKTGANWATIENTTAQNPFVKAKSYRFAYHAGIFFQVPFAQKWEVQPELMYSGKGYHIGSNTLTISPGTIRTNYIAAPVLVAFTPVSNLRLLTGPEFAYLLSGKFISGSETIDLQKLWDKYVDIGWAFGAEYTLFNKVNLGFRYVHGLLSVVRNIQFTDMNGEAISQANILNRAFQLYAAVPIKFNK